MSALTQPQEAMTIGEDPLPVIKINAIAVISILNHYVRRTDRQDRVIGTLLGTVKEGNVIEVTDSFGVPHQEKSDEILISKEYHKNMYSAHKRIFRRESIVGWYATCSPSAGGALIVDSSSLIHEFFCGECSFDPIHIVVDTTLAGDNVGIRAFVSQPMVVGPISFANMFQEVRVELAMSDAEVSCLHQMIAGQISDSPWENPKITSIIPSQQDELQQSAFKLQALIEKITNYVDRVIEGKEEPSVEIGMALANALEAVQIIRPEDFRSVFQEKVQDLVMVSYLSTLAQTQIAVAEKLSAIL